MIFFRAISWLPLSVLYVLAELGYLLIYYVIGYRKAVVMQNLSRAFPEKSSQEITILARKFYRQFVQVAFEIVKARRMSRDDFRRRVTLKNPELIERLSEGGKTSVIISSIHQGNWEWMLHGAAIGLNVPMDPVYKPLHNKASDQLIYEIRSQFGSRPLTMTESARDILRRRKEFRIFVMLADQAPTSSERSHWTQFLNQESAFYVGTETIAKLTRFPVAFSQCRRLRRGYYEIEFYEMGTPPYEKESHDITERYVALAEQAIRSEPESWLWSNRRWKRPRPDSEQNGSEGAASDQ